MSTSQKSIGAHSLAGGNTKEGLLRNEHPIQTPLRLPQEILSPSAHAQNPSPQIIRNSLHFSCQTKGHCCLLVGHIMGCRRVYWNCTGLLLEHSGEEPKVEKRRDLGNLRRNVCKKLKENGVKKCWTHVNIWSLCLPGHALYLIMVSSNVDSYPRQSGLDIQNNSTNCCP